MDSRDILGIVATLIAFISYIPYVWTIFTGKTKPHGFSWMVFALLMFIAFAAQVSDRAGAGAWVTGFSAAVCLLIAGLSLIKGTFKPTLSDWWAFGGSLAAIPIWMATDNPVYAVILITIIDMMAFYPTFRKAYFFPHEELLFTYLLSGVKFVLAFIALENITLTTALYPVSLIVMNWIFMAVILWRRKTTS